MRRRPILSATLGAAAAALLVAGTPSAMAGGWGDDSYVVQPTTLGPAPTPGAAGVYSDGGAYTYYSTDALSRLGDDPDGDFFYFSPRNGRSFRLVVPGHINVSCSNNVWIRGMGGQWFPETADGAGAQTDAHVLCPLSNGSEWRVFYPDTDCVTASRSGADLIGSRWTLSAPDTCNADVQFKASGKRGTFSSVATTPVPFVLTGTVFSSMTDWRTK